MSDVLNKSNFSELTLTYVIERKDSEAIWKLNVYPDAFGCNMSLEFEVWDRGHSNKNKEEEIGISLDQNQVKTLVAFLQSIID